MLSMYNKLKHIEGVNLLPKEVVGPALVGSVEYFNGRKIHTTDHSLQRRTDFL